MILATLALGAVTITLPARVEVRGTEIELGEVATIVTDDAALRLKFEDFDLGYAPAPGFSRLLDARRMATRLAGAFPGTDIRWGGEVQVRIHPETSVVSRSDITAVARQQISKMALGKDVEFKQTGALKDIVVPAGDSATVLRLRRGPISLRDGRNTVPIEILVDGQTYQTVWTTWDIKMWESVLVLTRNVALGEELTPGSVTYQRMTASEAGPKLGIKRASLLSTRASRALTKGDVLRHNDVVQLELIRSGDAATLEVKKGAIAARVSVIAKEGGHLGDRIRVVTTDTKKELTAVVIGRGRLRIELATN